jgi:hypothetical protein
MTTDYSDRTIMSQESMRHNFTTHEIEDEKKK